MSSDETSGLAARQHARRHTQRSGRAGSKQRAEAAPHRGYLPSFSTSAHAMPSNWKRSWACHQPFPRRAGCGHVFRRQVAPAQPKPSAVAVVLGRRTRPARMTVGLGHEQIPIERPEQGPGRDRNDLHSMLPELDRRPPDITEPAKLLFARGAVVHLGNRNWQTYRCQISLSTTSGPYARGEALARQARRRIDERRFRPMSKADNLPTARPENVRSKGSD